MNLTISDRQAFTPKPALGKQSQTSAVPFGGYTEYESETPTLDFSKPKEPGLRHKIHQKKAPIKKTGNALKLAGIASGLVALASGVIGIFPAQNTQNKQTQVTTSITTLTTEASQLDSFASNVAKQEKTVQISPQEADNLVREKLNNFVHNLDKTRALSFGLNEKGESFTDSTLFLSEDFQQNNPELMDAMLKEADGLQTVEDFEAFFDQWLNQIVVPQLQETNPDLLTRNTNAEFLKLANKNFSEAKEVLAKKVDDPFGRTEASLATVGLITLMGGFLANPIISNGLGKEFTDK